MDVCHVSHNGCHWQLVTRHFPIHGPDIFPGDSRKDWRSSGQLGRFESRLEVTSIRHLSHPLLDGVLRRALILRHSCIGCCHATKKRGMEKLRLFFCWGNCPTAFGKPCYFSMGFYNYSTREWTIFWLSSCAHAKEINWKRILGKDGFQFVVLKCLDSRHWHSMIPDLNIVYNVGLKNQRYIKDKIIFKSRPIFCSFSAFQISETGKTFVCC